MFAIIETGGKQYKVKQGLKFEVEKIEEADGAEIVFDKVLMVGEKIGAPYISGAKVKAKVIGQAKADKIKVFKMKAKKRYQKTQGHRQKLTSVEILEINA